MKLYYAPWSSALVPHIALREAGLAFELERVDLRTKKTAGDADYLRINPNGYVPALKFDDGTVLTEISAIVQWVADQVPANGLAPAAGTFARYRLMQWLSFVATELHRNFSLLSGTATPEETRARARAKIEKRLQHVDAHLAQQPYLLGDTYTVADIYLFTVLSWARALKLDLSAWPALAKYYAHIAERPKVREAIEAESEKKAEKKKP
jgi:glutathione S-transferase